MERSQEMEILEREGIPERDIQRAYRQLTRIHGLLGDTAWIISALRRDPLPVRRIVDIGCGRGGVLNEIRRKLKVEVVGVDLLLPDRQDEAFPILQADAVKDPLPRADVAFCMYLGHHLSESQLAKMIRNVGRSCRRFLLLDLVRHPLPLTLFRFFLAPFACPIVAEDGQISIRRSYTPAELKQIAREALAGTRAQFRYSSTLLQTRQILDISYNNAPARHQ
jgi:SAM-dependent methyltransferase